MLYAIKKGRFEIAKRPFSILVRGYFFFPPFFMSSFLAFFFIAYLLAVYWLGRGAAARNPLHACIRVPAA